MEIITFTNALGRSITFDYKSDWMIASYEGFGAASIEAINVKGYGQHGYTFAGLSYGTRVMDLRVFIYGKDMRELYERRADLISIFNPALGFGRLTYTNDYTTRFINCYTSYPPEPNEKLSTLCSFDIQLTATDPFWYDETEQGIKLAGATGGLTFGKDGSFFFDDSIIFGLSSSAGEINNTGDIETPIRVEISGSEITNPKLSLNSGNSGAFIKLNKTLTASDTAIITTGYGDKNVLINGESAMRYLDESSTFFSLPVGTNKITLSCESGEPTVSVFYRNRYAGV